MLQHGGIIFVVLAMMLMCADTLAELPAVNDLSESKLLPDPLVMFDGTAVSSPQQWENQRRPELKQLFEYYMYGKAPEPPKNFSFNIQSIDRNAFGGKATRKIVQLSFGPEGTKPVSLLLVVPNHKRPAPVFIGLNFVGNHTVMNDPNIPLPQSWINNEWSGGKDNRAHDEQRGIRSPSGTNPRWYIEKAVDRGYGVATMYAGEFSPDRRDGDYAFTDGVHCAYFKPGQTRPGPHEWATIAAWAWGLQRGVDYLVRDGDIDKSRIIAIGHSRLGKTALLAGAFDERIAMVIPCQSGTGGAAPSRSDVGESVQQINKRFPHWFNDTFKQFADNPAKLPFDQHCLISLVAPRPVLLTCATADIWCNPRGQFDMLIAAAPVYELLGVKEPLSTKEFPKENVLIDSTMGYFIRPGKHDMTETEWSAWLDFADKQLTN